MGLGVFAGAIVPYPPYPRPWGTYSAKAVRSRCCRLDESVHDRVHCDTGPTVYGRMGTLQFGKGQVEVLPKGADACEIRASQLREGRRAKDARGFIVGDELVHRDVTMCSVAREEGERQQVTIRTVGAYC
jgi:hypothetical protein